jgi:hypothetical protein
MIKRAGLATLAVLVLWTALDFILHGLILGGAYEATAELWRPMEEMKMGLIHIVTAISAICFVTIWTYMIRPQTMKNGVLFGLIFGIAAGISMGYGTYSSMPIPYYLAFAWFVGTIVEATLAGVVVALIVNEPAE